MRLPFGAFEPDKSKFNGTASASCVNVQPVANGWAPMPDLTVISEALGAECRGAAFVRTSGGVYTIIATTATGIASLDPTTLAWTDISGTSAPYNLGTGDMWTMTPYGSKLVIHNINDPTQVYDVEAGGVCADLPNAPQAKYSWVSGDFLVFGYLSGTNGDRMVKWSGNNDIEHYTPGVKFSDEQFLPEGGEVQAGFSDQGGFLVQCRSALHFFAFAPGSGFTFTRSLLNPKQGTIAPRSVVSIGPGRFFYLSEDGFFAGIDRQPIGAERVDEWFLEQIDQNYLGDVSGAADPFSKIVWWTFRIADGTFRRLGYDWQLDRWCYSDLQVGITVPLVTPGVTWDGLGDLYATIDDVDVPFDSRLFIGGRPTLATFNSSNELAFFTGANLAATLETSTVEPDPVARSFCNGARVVTDAATVSLTDTTFAYHGGTGTVSSASTMNRAGLIPMRTDGRLHKFTATIPAGTEWTIISDLEVNFQVSGKQ